MGPSSTIPAAIDALAVLLAAALPESVQVLDGPAVGVALRTDHVIIGGDLDEDSVTGLQEAASVGGQSRYERYDVLLQVGAYASGGGAQKVVRDRAFGYLAAVEALLRENPRLEVVPGVPVVRNAQVGSRLDLDQRPPSATNEAGEDVVLGRKAVITITVACQARI